MPLKFWERPRTSRFVAYNLFSMIAGTQTPLPAVEAYEHAVNLVGEEVNIRYEPDNLSQPRLVYARSGSALIIAIAGAQTVYMFQGLLRGYAFPAASVNNSGVNAFGDPTAMSIAAQTSTLMGELDHVLIGGYSYGSVVAWGIYNYLNQYHPAKDVRLITYGGPKPGQLPLARRYTHYGNDKVIQYTNDNDPVPYVYPNSEQGPTVHGNMVPEQSRQANAYQHVLPFYELDTAGEGTRIVPYPTRVNANIEIAIASWIAGTEGWNTSGHHWTTYKQRLFLLMRRHPDIVSEGAPRLIEQVDSGTIPTNLSATFTPESPPLYSPGNPIVPLPESPLTPTAVRRGSGGVKVEWNGIPIATYRSRTKARNLRNVLKRLATAYRQAEEFEYESLDDAVFYNRALEQNHQPTVIR